MIGVTDITPREEAIADCRYAKSLGNVALSHHFDIWLTLVDEGDVSDNEYHSTIFEIECKLDTKECLLKEV